MKQRSKRGDDARWWANVIDGIDKKRGKKLRVEAYRHDKDATNRKKTQARHLSKIRAIPEPTQ